MHVITRMYSQTLNNKLVSTHGMPWRPYHALQYRRMIGQTPMENCKVLSDSESELHITQTLFMPVFHDPRLHSRSKRRVILAECEPFELVGSIQLLGSRREFSIIYKLIQSIHKWSSSFANGLVYSQICSSFTNGRSIYKRTKIAARLHKSFLQNNVVS